MPDDTSDRVKTYQALSDAHELAEDGIVLAKKGLLRNPSPEERRDLDKQILELGEQSTLIWEMMIAIRTETKTIKMPKQEQINEIARLSGEVEALTKGAINASQAVVLAGKVLDIAAKVATPVT